MAFHFLRKVHRKEWCANIPTSKLGNIGEDLPFSGLYTPGSRAAVTKVRDAHGDWLATRGKVGSYLVEDK